jgi:CMP-N-acetylneuraminic acid synthetase
MKTISVLINARLQSSRIPQKLVRPFASTNLISIALEKIEQMGFFKHRYLAVAEEELKRFVSGYPHVELLERSLESVKPGYGNHKVIYEHYSWIDSDYIFWLNPCHPLLSIETVKSAVDIFQDTDHNSYTAVVPTREWLFDEAGHPVTHTSGSTLSTAHSARFFKATHSFHIINKDYFLRTYQYWTMTQNDPYLIAVPASENFDCDTPVQFQTAEAVYKSRSCQTS